MEQLYLQIKKFLKASDPESISGRTDLLNGMGLRHLSGKISKQGSQDDFAGALLGEIISRGQTQLEEFLKQLGTPERFGKEDLEELKKLQDAIVALSPEQWRDTFANQIESGFVPSQQVLLAELQRNFVGRRDDITWIEQRLANQSRSNHIVIHAPAGYGKSALMARLIELYPDYIYYFIRVEDQNHTATSLLANLCGQLSTRIGRPRSYVGVELGKLEEEYKRLQIQVMDSLDQDSQLVIVIDGLDEAERHGDNSILKPEYFRTASSRLRFILTHRSGSLDLALLDIREYQEKELCGLSSEDVVTLFKHLKRNDLADDGQLVNQIIDKTNGEPFYLRFLVEDLSKEKAPVKLPEDLPPDSKVYIKRQIKELLNKEELLSLIPQTVRELYRIDSIKAAKQILQTLAVAQDWLTRAQLMRILSHVDSDLVEFLINPLRRYFVTDRPDEISRTSSERYLITPLKLKEAVRDTFTNDELQVAEQLLLTFCREWSRVENNPYAFNYLTHHLISLGQYGEMLDVLDEPFLRAKAAALKGTHTVQVDIQRGLRECVERSDHLKIIRMLLLLARTKNFAEQRAFYGGIVIDANKGLYEIALASAHAIDDIEMRFRQLLLIVEAAAHNDDRAYLVEALDEALGLEIIQSKFPDQDLKGLLYQLIVQYRETNRALALADKINDRLKNWSLEQSCLTLIERDAGYAMELLDRVDTWVSLWQKLVPRVIESQPDIAHQLLTYAQRRANDPGHSSLLLLIATTLRKIDTRAAEKIVRSILSDLNQQHWDQNRKLGMLINHATMELAYFSLTEAIDLALTKCPYIGDSIESLTGRFHTQYGTLAHILTIANETGVQIPRDLLQMIFATVQPENQPEYPEMCNEVLHGLVLQFALQSNLQAANAARALIEAPKMQAKTLLTLARTHPVLDILEVVQTLLATGNPPEDSVLEEFKCLYSEQEAFALQILSAVEEYPVVHFELANSILEVQKLCDKQLIEICLKIVATMQPMNQVSSFRRLAETVARHDVEAAKQILQGAFRFIHPLDNWQDQQLEWHKIAEVASNISLGDMAAQAVCFQLEALQKSPNVRDHDFENLARFVLQRKITISDDTLIALLNQIRDPYTAGKVVSFLSDGEVYVNRQLEMSRLDLSSTVYISLLVEAWKAKAVTSLRHLLDLFLVEEDKAFLLTKIGEIECDIGNILSAKEDLERAWNILEEVQVPTDVPTKTIQDFNDQLDKGRLQVIEVWSLFDPQAVVELSTHLSPWRQHLAVSIAASQMKNDPEEALRIFQRAYAIAKTMDDSAVNRHHAMWNVYSYSRKSHPEFAKNCLDEAIVQLDDVDKPNDRIVAYLRLIVWKDRLPDYITTQLWNRLAEEAKRYILTGRELFKAVEQLTEKEDLRTVCMHIASSLIKGHNLHNDHSEEVAHLALILARADLSREAKSLLGEWDHLQATSNKWNKHRSRAYQVCAEKWLKLDEAENDLKSLLRILRKEAETDLRWTLNSVADAVCIIGREYNEVTDDDESWEMIVELCNHFKLQERSEPLLALIDGAIQTQTFEKAISLLAYFPVSTYQAEAVNRICSKLQPHIGFELDRNQKRIWQRVFDIASYNVVSLLYYAQAWCEALLELQPSTDAVDSMVAAILSECEFVQKS